MDRTIEFPGCLEKGLPGMCIHRSSTLPLFYFSSKTDTANKNNETCIESLNALGQDIFLPTLEMLKSFSKNDKKFNSVERLMTYGSMLGLIF